VIGVFSPLVLQVGVVARTEPVKMVVRLRVVEYFMAFLEP
jgi:hypothetical protein